MGICQRKTLGGCTPCLSGLCQKEFAAIVCDSSQFFKKGILILISGPVEEGFYVNGAATESRRCSDHRLRLCVWLTSTTLMFGSICSLFSVVLSETSIFKGVMFTKWR